MSTIKIDPKDFVGGPFRTCPKCAANEFGVLMVAGNSYHRRCRACWHTVKIPLPTLKKRVIYLDQFAISNIMKLHSPKTTGHSRVTLEPFWRELFEIIDVICGLQLAIAPDSEEHENESLAAPFFAALKNTYEYFSGGVTFNHSDSIRRRQICELAEAWIRKEHVRHDFNPARVTHGRINDWQDRIRISISSFKGDLVDEIRSSRDRVHAELGKVFYRWQKEGKQFEDWFEEERTSYATYVLAGFIGDLRQRQAVMNGLEPLTLEALLPGPHSILLVSVMEIFRTADVSEEELADVVLQFFASGATKDAPFNVIASSMYASLAAKARAGQKELPNRGTAGDITLVSTLLPYCDAMFVDNKCKALLDDIPKTHSLTFPCRVFSPNSQTDFLAYLRDIREAASEDHLKLTRDVYGEEAERPSSGIPGLAR